MEHHNDATHDKMSDVKPRGVFVNRKDRRFPRKEQQEALLLKTTAVCGEGPATQMDDLRADQWFDGTLNAVPEAPTADGVEELLRDHQRYHSTLQIDRFITVRSGGTPYGMLRQALRELASRRRTLHQAYLDHERLELRERTLLVTTAEGPLSGAWERLLSPLRVLRHALRPRPSRRSLELELQEVRFQIGESRNQIRDGCREFRRFYAQARALRDKIGSLTEPVRAKLDREFWIHQLKFQAAVDALSDPEGRIRQTTIELALSLPIEDRVELFQVFGKTGDLMLWAKSFEHEPIDVPEVLPEPKEMRQLLERTAIMELED